MLHDPADGFTGSFPFCEELAPSMPKPYLGLEKCGGPFFISPKHHATQRLSAQRRLGTQEDLTPP